MAETTRSKAANRRARRQAGKADGTSVPSTEPPPARSGEPALTRERLRELIQAEVDGQRPLEETRQAVILMAESAVRLVEDDGTAGFVVVGPDGEPRTILKDGEAVPFALHDLAGELRRMYPTLFQAEPSPAASVSPSEESAGVAAEPAPPRRDWLMVESAAPEAPPRLAPVGAAVLDRLRRRWRQAAERVEGWRAARPAPQPGTDKGPAASPGARAQILVRSWLGPALGERTDARQASTPAAVLGRLRRRWRETAARVEGWRAARPAPQPRTAGNATALPPAGASLPVGGGFRPSYAVYAALAVALGTLLLVLLPSREAGPPSGARPGTGARMQSAGGPAPGRVPTGAAQAPGAGGANASGPLKGVPEVVDTSTLRLNGKIVHLFGVEWARGAQAEDLTRYLAGREVVCTPSPRVDQQRCQVDGHDLSEVVLFNGGGRATSDATPELKAAEAHARTASLGVWQKP